MKTKEKLQGFLLGKLKEMEDARHAAGKMPAAVLMSEYKSGIMDDMMAELEELKSHGIVEIGRTLNDQYVHINPENALEG